MIAQEMGFNLSGFVAGLGLGGLALALGAKDALVSIAFPSRSIYLENASTDHPWPDMVQLEYHTRPDNQQIEIIPK